MRALVLTLVLALAAAPLLPAAAALPPPATCNDATSTTANNFDWSPTCLRIASGTVITFVGGTGTHNAKSSQDDNLVLRLLGPACFATPNFNTGQTAAVRFVNNENGVTASVRNPDGSFAPPVDCSNAVDPLASGSDTAAIPFKCGIHGSMTGRILVEG